MLSPWKLVVQWVGDAGSHSTDPDRQKQTSDADRNNQNKERWKIQLKKVKEMFQYLNDSSSHILSPTLLPSKV